MGRIEWWRLRPDGELVDQPHPGDPRRYVGAARSEAGDLAVVYVPEGVERLRVRDDRLRGKGSGRWFDPRMGEFAEMEMGVEGMRVPVEGDWVWVWDLRS